MQSERISKYYSEREGQAYSAWQLKAAAGVGPIVGRKFQRHIRPADTVVDFGCGGGAALANIRCARRIGIEANPNSRPEAQRNGLEVHESLSDLPDGIADVVISHHALEHTLQPYAELRAIRRVLKPGGTFVLILPVDDWRNQRTYRRGDVNRHLYTWTPLLIGQLMEEAGFRVRSARIVSKAWPPKPAFFNRILPRPLFEAACAVWSRVINLRELVAIADAA